MRIALLCLMLTGCGPSNPIVEVKEFRDQVSYITETRGCLTTTYQLTPIRRTHRNGNVEMDYIKTMVSSYRSCQ